MPRSRWRVAVAGAVTVAVVAVATVVVVERGRRTSLEARVARPEEQRRGGDQEAAPGGAGVDDGPGDGGADDLLGRLAEALGGGAAGGGLGGTAAEDCAPVLAGAAPDGGLGSLFGGGEGGGEGGDPAHQVRDVAAALEELRELRFERVPEPVYVSPAELARRVRAQLSEDLAPEEVAGEARGLVALGALEPGADLRAITLEALGQQVAGYYEPATGALVVGRAESSEGLDGQARMVLAHELDHALTDQVLDLPVGDGRPPAGAEDAALARLTLVEGDATLAMQLYALRHVGLLEQLRGLGGALGAQEQLARLPHHVRRGLTFPYLQGLAFACRLHAGGGGWKGVDRAYDEPPSTTAQVLFPERYTAGEQAVDPRDPAPPGAGWRAEPRRAFGAAELLWLLEAPGNDPDRALDDPLGRVAAWAGGELQVWTDGDRTAATLALVQRPGEPSLCATTVAWYTAAFPGGRAGDEGAGEEMAVDGAAQDAVLRCTGPDVRLGLGPDLTVARAAAR